MIKYPHGIHLKARIKPRKKRRSKFNAHVLNVNGVRYDSKLEFNFANFLKNKHVNFIYHPDSIRIVDPYMNGSKKHRGNKFTPTVVFLSILPFSIKSLVVFVAARSIASWYFCLVYPSIKTTPFDIVPNSYHK